MMLKVPNEPKNEYRAYYLSARKMSRNLKEREREKREKLRNGEREREREKRERN